MKSLYDRQVAEKETTLSSKIASIEFFLKGIPFD